jgi:hypothetical protein
MDETELSLPLGEWLELCDARREADAERLAAVLVVRIIDRHGAYVIVSDERVSGDRMELLRPGECLTFRAGEARAAEIELADASAGHAHFLLRLGLLERLEAEGQRRDEIAALVNALETRGD